MRYSVAMRMRWRSKCALIRRRSSRATSSWRVGAVRTCNSSVAPAGLSASTPRTRGRPRAPWTNRHPRETPWRPVREPQAPVQWRVRRDGHLEEDLGPVAAEISHLLNLTVGDGDDGALGAAEHGTANGEEFHAAGEVSGSN